MEERFLVVFGKTRIELVTELNKKYSDMGRVIAWEHDDDGYFAVLDTYALVVATLEDINNEQAEYERREYNREVLQQIELKTAKTG